MTKKELYRRAQAHGAQRFSGDAEDGWIAGYKAARTDLRREIERKLDLPMSFQLRVMHWLRPIR